MSEPACPIASFSIDGQVVAEGAHCEEVAPHGGLERDRLAQHRRRAAAAAVARADSVAENQSHGLLCHPEPVARLRGDESRRFVSNR